MSRIGKKPVPITGSAKVSVNDRQIVVEAGSNRLSFVHRPEVNVVVDGNDVVVTRINDTSVAKAMHGLTRAMVANMIHGVTKGFEKQLEIIGVGWQARVQGKKIMLDVGYADTREVMIPDGVTVEVQQNKITIKGADKQKVGQTAAVIRGQRKPEPYNGKGIKYVDEVIIRKQGKAFAGGG